MQPTENCHAKKDEESPWPREIRRGGGIATIYKTTNRGRVLYQSVCWIGGKRERKSFAKFADARTHAEAQATAINLGHFAVAQMKDGDRQAYVAAERLLKGLNTPLLNAVQSYVAAVNALKGTGSLLDAAKEYQAKHSKKLHEMTVAEVVAAFMAEKRGTPGLDSRYVENLANDCKRLSETFLKLISQVRAEDAQDWIRGLRNPRTGQALGWKRQNDWRALIVEIASYARDVKAALPNEPLALAKIKPLKKQDSEIGILTPEEMQKLLNAALEKGKTETLLFLCIGGFAGLRPIDETLLLDWSDVDLARGQIRIRTENAKTGAKRFAPIEKNLRAWLLPHAKSKGPVFTENANERAQYFAKQEGVPIPFDGLRHSYGTYRVSLTRDLERVSHEMGNSRAVIKKHYDSVRTEDEGSAWFAIMPDAPENVVAMSA